MVQGGGVHAARRIRIHMMWTYTRIFYQRIISDSDGLYKSSVMGQSLLIANCSQDGTIRRASGPRATVDPE